MPTLLKKCRDCGTYTMKEGPCKNCNSNAVHSVYPPRFSVEDKYGKYRRAMKEKIRKKEKV
ncbi:ribosome biogenesis protein [Candidatus Bathyarchaeota archaeon]|nr:ribosome biogenesis protein [Candidatus Bathyarchaeota archaeon]